MAWASFVFGLGVAMGHGNCNGFALNVYDSGSLVYHTGQATGWSLQPTIMTEP
jgi:hypothetical protein